LSKRIGNFARNTLQHTNKASAGKMMKYQSALCCFLNVFKIQVLNKLLNTHVLPFWSKFVWLRWLWKKKTFSYLHFQKKKQFVSFGDTL
jgi:hypothetical protein